MQISSGERCRHNQHPCFLELSVPQPEQHMRRLRKPQSHRPTAWKRWPHKITPPLNGSGIGVACVLGCGRVAAKQLSAPTNKFQPQPIHGVSKGGGDLQWLDMESQQNDKQHGSNGVGCGCAVCTCAPQEVLRTIMEHPRQQTPTCEWLGMPSEKAEHGPGEKTLANMQSAWRRPCGGSTRNHEHKESLPN